MATGWSRIKLLGRPSRDGGKPLITEAAVAEFELGDDSSLSSEPTSPRSFSSWNSAASSVSSFASSGLIRRLGSGRPDSEASVLFDGEMSESTDPTNHSVSVGPLNIHKDEPEPAELHVAPARSALTFMQRITELGNNMPKAIQQEVHIRQLQKVREFSQAEKTSGFDAAVTYTMAGIAGQRNEELKDTELASMIQTLKVESRGLNQQDRASLALEKIQSHYHQGRSRGSNMSSAEIAKNFAKNGSSLESARIALAYVAASHDYISATEVSAASVSRNPLTTGGVEKTGTSRASFDDLSRGRNHQSVVR